MGTPYSQPCCTEGTCLWVLGMVKPCLHTSGLTKRVTLPSLSRLQMCKLCPSGGGPEFQFAPRTPLVFFADKLLNIHVHNWGQVQYHFFLWCLYFLQSYIQFQHWQGRICTCIGCGDWPRFLTFLSSEFNKQKNVLKNNFATRRTTRPQESYCPLEQKLIMSASLSQKTCKEWGQERERIEDKKRQSVQKDLFPLLSFFLSLSPFCPLSLSFLLSLCLSFFLFLFPSWNLFRFLSLFPWLPHHTTGCVLTALGAI